LLEGREFPTIGELESSDVADFAAQSVLLDFTCGRENPAMPYVGAAIRDECGLDDSMRTIADVPSRSLLSRLTDHYMQIIANRAPVGFEAEFENQRDESICYRGILMPFSSDGDTIDFIYGVINWKTVGEAEDAPDAAEPLADAASDPLAEIELDDDAGLAERLWAARETAEAVKSADGRTRAALYRALSLAYDFSIAADQNPEDYAELLEESGVKAQARA